MSSEATAQATNKVEGDMFSSIQVDNEVQQPTLNILNPRHAFVEKLIHPPSAVEAYAGLPTNDTRSQVTVEWRNMNLLNQIVGYDNSINKYRPYVSEDFTAFDYGFYIPNGLRINAIPYFSNKYGTNVGTNNAMTQDIGNVQIQDLYDFQRFQADAQVSRIVYRSCTAYLNATAFNDTGMVVISQFNPSLLFTGTIGKFLIMYPHHARQFVSQNIDIRALDLNAVNTRPKIFTVTRRTTPNTDNACWRDIPDYIKNDLHSHLHISSPYEISFPADAKIQFICLGTQGNAARGNEFPTMSQILTSSSRSYGGKAKEGGFVVNRMNTIAPHWCNASNAQENGLYYCYFYFIDQIGVAHFVPYAEMRPNSMEEQIMQDTQWTEDLTWTQVLFSGISFNPTSVASVTLQMLALKFYTGVEIQPAPMSPWAGTQRLSPKPDLMAMQSLMDAFYELKDGFPARYNFWGALGQMAASGLSEFGSSLLKNMMKPKKSKVDKDVKKIERDVKKLHVDERRPRNQSRSRKPRRSQSRQRSSSRRRSTSRKPQQKKRHRRPRKAPAVKPRKTVTIAPTAEEFIEQQ